MVLVSGLLDIIFLSGLCPCPKVFILTCSPGIPHCFIESHGVGTSVEEMHQNVVSGSCFSQTSSSRLRAEGSCGLHVREGGVQAWGWFWEPWKESQQRR